MIDTSISLFAPTGHFYCSRSFRSLTDTLSRSGDFLVAPTASLICSSCETKHPPGLLECPSNRPSALSTFLNSVVLQPGLTYIKWAGAPFIQPITPSWAWICFFHIVSIVYLFEEGFAVFILEQEMKRVFHFCYWPNPFFFFSLTLQLPYARFEQKHVPRSF